MEAQVPVLPINVMQSSQRGPESHSHRSGPISVEPRDPSFFDHSKLFDFFFHCFFLLRPILVKNLPSNPYMDTSPSSMSKSMHSSRI